MQSASTIINHEKFSLDNWGYRWERARRSAIEKVLGPTDSGISEAELLSMLPRGTQDEVLRGVFDNSRRLGLSCSKFLGLTWELSDFQEILSLLPNPCVRGAWENRATAKVITRPGCDQVKVTGSVLCDYWREAFDGLVVGLGEDERFSRHQSVGHGDSQCTDVIFVDKIERDAPSPRWRAIPNSHLVDLSGIQRDFQNRFAMKIEFLGLAEGVLYCKWSSDKNLSCGTSGKILWNYLNEAVQKKMPGVKLQDTSPLAVLGSEQ